MTPGELIALDRPIPCAWCLQRLALAGEGSNYCEECRETLRPRAWREDDQPVVYDGSELEPSARYPQVRGDLMQGTEADWLDEDALSHVEEGDPE